MKARFIYILLLLASVISAQNETKLHPVQLDAAGASENEVLTFNSGQWRPRTIPTRTGISERIIYGNYEQDELFTYDGSKLGMNVTVNGTGVFITGKGSGYGIWLLNNSYYDAGQWKKIRPNIRAMGLTVNHHRGFSLLNFISSTNSYYADATEEELLKITPNGDIFQNNVKNSFVYADHNGKLIARNENDPTVPLHVKNISTNDIANWNLDNSVFNEKSNFSLVETDDTWWYIDANGSGNQTGVGLKMGAGLSATASGNVLTLKSLSHSALIDSQIVYGNYEQDELFTYDGSKLGMNVTVNGTGGFITGKGSGYGIWLLNNSYYEAGQWKKIRPNIRAMGLTVNHHRGFSVLNFISSTNSYYADATEEEIFKVNPNGDIFQNNVKNSFVYADHNGRLIARTENDPTVPLHVKNISTNDIANWNNDEVGITSLSLGNGLTGDATSSSPLTVNFAEGIVNGTGNTVIGVSGMKVRINNIYTPTVTQDGNGAQVAFPDNSSFDIEGSENIDVTVVNNAASIAYKSTYLYTAIGYKQGLAASTFFKRKLDTNTFQEAGFTYMTSDSTFTVDQTGLYRLEFIINQSIQAGVELLSQFQINIGSNGIADQIQLVAPRYSSLIVHRAVGTSILTLTSGNNYHISQRSTTDGKLPNFQLVITKIN